MGFDDLGSYAARLDGSVDTPTPLGDSSRDTHEPATDARVQPDGSMDARVDAPLADTLQPDRNMDQAIDAPLADTLRPDGTMDQAIDAPLADTLPPDGTMDARVDAPAIPTQSWAQSFGHSLADDSFGVAVDGNGNITMTGGFQGIVDFGGGALTSMGSPDVFVASYDPTGVHRWSKRFGDAAAQFGKSVAVDVSGNVMVTGSFEGTVDFGGGVLTSAGQSDIFVVSFAPNGSHRWSKGLGGTWTDQSIAIAGDASGNVVIAGSFWTDVDFGGGPLTSAGGSDIFIASYHPDGSHRWSKRFGATYADSSYDVATDGDGNVIILGGFGRTVDFGGGPLTSAGNNDIVVASYDSNGAHRWSRHFGGTSYDYGRGVATDSSGNVTITGFFPGTVDFGGGPLTSTGTNNIFLASYDSSGVHRWSKSFGGAVSQSGQDVSIDVSGNVVFIGHFRDVIDMGGGPLTSTGNEDIVVASYDSAGIHRWSRRLGGSLNDQGRGVAVDRGDNVIITGIFRDIVDFDETLTSAGETDIFLLRNQQP
ncbi:MAG: SBBP repeat-containing protein [Deltaproteobacteria bacterium]|nr:SBBP repeat-containing protein [Deltaproteobacteria bacterium]